MRISQLRIQNFRAFDDETIEFGEYNCLVGPNGAGKSTILNALNVVFRDQRDPTDVTILEAEDFHLKNTSEPIQITVTFTDLSDDAKEDLSAYVRQEKLMLKVKAEWDPAAEQAEAIQYGVRDVIQDFAEYFKRDDEGAYADELKEIYSNLREEYPELPHETVKAQMQQALRDYEESHPDLCSPTDSNDQFYGWSRGTNKLDKYVQWVYVPAVKDPTEEQEEASGTALGELLSRTIRAKVDFDTPLRELREEITERYQSVVDAEKGALEDLEDSIQSRLRDWAHPGASVELHWNFDPDKSVSLKEPSAKTRLGEGQFMGELVRLGHGLQRSFLLAVLQEEALTGSETAPTLLLAIEEPELYQHPPQARHLATVLNRLSTQNSQVLVTTHSPYFVSTQGFRDIRMTRKDFESGSASVARYSPEELSKAIAVALDHDVRAPMATMAAAEQIMIPSRAELYFARVPVLVEGPEDIAFLSSCVLLQGKWEKFRKLGCHFIECGGKTSMSRPLAIANGLGIPAFCVIDADADKEEHRKSNERNNRCIARLCGESPDAFPDDPYYGERVVIWPEQIGSAVRADVGEDIWSEAEQRARNEYELTSGVKRKNPLLISKTLNLLHEDGIVPATLREACDAILAFAVDRQGS